jgi:hypothetical protein
MDPASIVLLSMIGMSFLGSLCAIYNDARADEQLRINLIKHRRSYYYTFGRKRRRRTMKIPSPIPEGIE